MLATELFCRYASKVGDPDTASVSCWWPSSLAATTYRVGAVRAVASSAYGSFLFGAGLAAMYGSLWLGLRLVAAGDLSIGRREFAKTNNNIPVILTVAVTL
jgi:hypothetical protein